MIWRDEAGRTIMLTLAVFAAVGLAVAAWVGLWFW